MKKSRFYYIYIALAALTVISCGCKKTPVLVQEQGEVLTYEVSKADFCNPERGYYTQYTKKFANGNVPSPISASAIKSKRSENQTITLSMFYLTDFMEGDISEAALNVIGESLKAHRTAGSKAIVRFAYKDSYDESSAPFDPVVDIVLRHIEQLKPLLQEYSDIIMLFQAGFIGSWGEWAFTTHFTITDDASYAPRKQVVDALLDALPKDRQVALRTATYKRRMYGMTLADTITAQTAFNGSDLSRLGGHNDCFISSSNDVGTYSGNTDRIQWKHETEYTLMGGETCSGDATYCNCTHSIEELEAYHWTYQNRNYHSGTFTEWLKGGCMDENSIRLGYRLVLKQAAFNSDFTAGSSLTVKYSIENVGFAALSNPRGLEFILKDNESGALTVYKSETDPRRWAAGKESVNTETITLPEELVAGKRYSLYMNLPDGRESLHDNPLYSVRLANEGLWSEKTGYNKICEFIAK